MANPARISFPVKFARRMPDPVFHDQGVERHFLMIAARDIPPGIPTDANPRPANIRRAVYRDVERSLMAPDGQFHLKHKGITVVAEAVEKLNDELYEIVFLPKNHGILDGGHTYKLITEAQKSGELPSNQYVKFEVITKAPVEWIPDIAGGLNTSVQLEDMTLENAKGAFDWLQALIKDEPYAASIAWRENEDRELDARDVVSILTCLNVGLFPAEGDTHPVKAYSQKAVTLDDYVKNVKSFEAMRPIVKDIFVLYDLIRGGAQSKWNGDGGKFGALAFVEEKRGKGGFSYPFNEGSPRHRLMNSAAYPILSAFRWMVVRDETSGAYTWRGGFSEVKALWEEAALDLLRATKEASDSLGRNPNALGKSKNLWGQLLDKVIKRDLLRQRR